jgi:hypothetical protein
MWNGDFPRLTAELAGDAAATITAHRLAVLVLTIAARIELRIFGLVVAPDAVARLAALISGILTLVTTTDSQMEKLAAALGELLEILEAAITHFVVLFRRDYLGQPKPIIDRIDAALVPPGTFQDVFNLFVD